MISDFCSIILTFVVVETAEVYSSGAFVEYNCGFFRWEKSCFGSKFQIGIAYAFNMSRQLAGVFFE